MRKMKIEVTPLQCRATDTHNAHQWYGNLEAGPEPGYHECSGISERAMTRQELREWFALRGVEDADMDQWLDEYAGKTETEMDDHYAALHGDMA